MAIVGEEFRLSLSGYLLFMCQGIFRDHPFKCEGYAEVGMAEEEVTKTGQCGCLDLDLYEICGLAWWLIVERLGGWLVIVYLIAWLMADCCWLLSVGSRGIVMVFGGTWRWLLMLDGVRFCLMACDCVECCSSLLWVRVSVLSCDLDGDRCLLRTCFFVVGS